MSRRLTGVPAARLADSWRIRRSPMEQGRSPMAKVLAAGDALGCLAHGARWEPAVMLECHGQAGGLDLAEPV